ncbi:MAG: YfiR family protein [Acidobacteria bacterium]|nr:YfiR family protein [Acidobacteriota bacterium]
MVARRPLRAVALALALLAVTLASPAQSAAPTAEYRVKAAFLLNFIHFVDWPPGAFASRDAPLVICVVGVDPFGEALDQTIEGETIDQRRIVVRRSRTGADAQGCQLVFISRSEGNRLDDVFASMGSTAPVLTVSDIDGFVPRGGTIGFLLDRNRVRFEIGLSTAQRRHLKVSSQLLSLGRIVQ